MFLAVHQLNLLETISLDENEENKQENKNGDNRPRLITRLKIELWNKKPENKEKLFYQAPYDSKTLESLRSNC